MLTSKTASEPNSVAKTTIIDGLRRRLSVEAACNAADIQKRTAYNWRKADPVFAALWGEAVEDAEHLVNRRQVADWQADLIRVETDLAEIESGITEVSAMAMAGDPDAITKRDELRARHRTVAESADALRVAIKSGAAHIARQDAARVEADRLVAADEADVHLTEQRKAAARVDAALIELGIGWREFQAASALRQSATRRSGGRSRGAYKTSLINAAFKLCLSAADDMGLDRRVKTPGCRSLTDLLN